MALSFPVSPVNGQIYIADNGITYVYSNGKWTGQVTGNISGFTDRLVAGNVNLTFDANGNIVFPGGETLQVDGENLLVNGNVYSSGTAYSNANVAAYLTDNNYATEIYVTNQIANIVIPVTYSNVNVAAYLTTEGYAKTSDITSANLGIIGYVDRANTIQSNQITAANVGIKGYVDAQTYTNVNVASYFLDGTPKTIAGNLTIEGNLIVNGNVTYISVNNLAVGDNIINLADLNPNDSLDLGITAHRNINGILQHTGLVRDASANQWRLFSNVPQDVGTTVDFTDAIYDDLVLGNITSPTIDSLVNVITAANIGIIGYIDQANTIQSQQITAANVGIIGYIDSQNFYSNTKVAAYLPTYSGNIANIRLGISGVLTFSDGTINNGGAVYAAANASVQMISNNEYTQVRVDNANVEIYTSPNGSTQYQWTFGNNGNLTLPAGGQILDSTGNLYVTGGGGSYSNVQVATYLPTYTGTLAGGTLNLAGQDGTTVVDFQTGAGTNQIITLGSNYTFSIKAGAAASNRGSLVLESGQNSRVRINGNGSNVLITAGNGTQSSTWTFANSGVLTFPDGTTQSTAASGSNYGNVNVKAYTEAMGFQNYGNANVTAYLPSHTGNVGVNYLLGTTPNVTVTAGSYNSVFDTTGNVILPTAYVTGNVTAGYFIGNGALLTGIAASSNYSNVQVEVFANLSNYAYNANVTSANLGMKGYVDNSVSTANIGMKGYVDSVASQSIYGNVNVKAYTESMGFTNYSNVNVASYLSTATINTTGNITAAYITGNISITGNVTGTSPNVTIQAGSYSSVFDNLGNVTVPKLFSTGNIQTAGYLFGNGAFLTGIVAGSSYSNVQVATYLPTYTGVVTASNVTVAGNVTAQYLFGNGSQLTGLPSSYSNVNVATYLPTYSGNIANIRLGVSGVLTFADGTTQTTAGGGSYSNVQVATYLPTYTGVITASNVSVAGNVTAQFLFGNGSQLTGIAGNYSNVQVATYLPLYGGAVQSSNVQTTSANIQATTAATNTATGALRVMGGVGVAGTVFAAQFNTTGNLVANTVTAYSLNTVANVVASVVNAGTINSSGNVLAQNLVGTIATASQTNITAVGTLATLAVSGNATVGNLVGNEANTRIIANVYTTTFDIYGNVTFPGNITVGGFGAVMPTRPAFRVNGTAGPVQTTSNVNLKSPQTSVVFNQGGYYNDTNGKFTAPVAGIYEVSMVARVNTNSTSQIAVLKNGLNSGGNIVCFWEADASTGTATHFGTSGTVVLAAGDYLSANILLGNITFDGNDNWCVTYLG